MNKTLAALGAGVLGVALLGGCSSEPEWVAVYEQCKQTVSDSDITQIQQPREGEDEPTRAMRESMGNMAMSMALGACEMIKSACEDDPDGATCQAFIKKRQ